jgi:hypothetical protein
MISTTTGTTLQEDSYLYLEYESKREPSSTLKKQEKLDDSITMEIDKFMNVHLQE